MSNDHRAASRLNKSKAEFEPHGEETKRFTFSSGFFSKSRPEATGDPYPDSLLPLSEEVLRGEKIVFSGC